MSHYGSGQSTANAHHSSQIEPGWHAWMSYNVDKSPVADPLLQRQVRVWEPKEHRPTLTWSRSGYKPYSTYVFVYETLWTDTDGSIGSRTSTRRGHRWPSRDSKQ